MAEKAETCQMCGTAAWEWEENKFAYEPEERHCKGCYLKHVANEDKKTLPGTTIELVRVTPRRLAEQQIMAEKRRRMTRE